MRKLDFGSLPGRGARALALGLALVCLDIAQMRPLEAASVYVTAVGVNEVQLIIDGRTVRNVRVGQTTPEGVTLTAIRSGTAVLSIGGRSLSLGIGQSTVSEAAIQAEPSGHFVVDAHLNGVAMRSVVDTGATNVTLNLDHARRLGLDLTRSRRIVTQTANGPANAYLITLASVRVGNLAIENVPAAVIEGGADRLPIVLLGMSFLRHVEMRRAGDSMTLSRPDLR